MASTLLSTLLSRMRRYQSVATIDEPYLIRDLDDALRTIKRSHDLPFFIKKGSLKVFAGIYEYTPASDHDYLIYVDYQKQNLPFGQHLRARYTSLQQFYEDPDNRSQLAEIWNNNNLTLGVRVQNTAQLGQFQTLDEADSTTNVTASGDASGLVLDNVNFVNGESSLRFTVTQSSNTATVERTFTGFTDSLYARKWYFRWVYLDAVPTSVTLKFGADASNYLTGTATAQFSGQAFAADQWNLVAFDLNGATTVGTISTSTVFAYESIALNTATSGTYNIDLSSIRAWDLLDYWYYSKFSVINSGSTTPDREYFMDSADTYSTAAALAGDAEWADVIMYDALCTSLTDKENMVVLNEMKAKKAEAWERLEEKWPSLKPNMTSTRYRWGTEYANTMGDWPYQW